jgi:hypothetical protein
VLAVSVADFEFKNFDQSNGLLQRDIDRNLEFMELTDSIKSNQIQLGVLTFFLHDKNSIIKEDAVQFLTEKALEFSAMAAKYNRAGISLKLTLKALVNYLELSRNYAQPLNKVDSHSFESEENHHIAFGVILLQRKITL